MKYQSLARTALLLGAGLAALRCAAPPGDPGSASPAGDAFEGRFFRGRGDRSWFELLEFSRRVFEPDPEHQYLGMLYMPSWNGLVEGPTWDAWWIQNSYGTSYAAMPFWLEPYPTFLQNSQDLWFDQMGDGRRAGAHGWVAPDGCLCDCAKPGWIVYRQGDGRIDTHDWAVEFTAAGILLQSELLLIGRDRAAIDRYLPMLERCAEFVESRRDPATNLFLAGPAGNLLAPSHAGWKKPDGSYDKSYLAGLSVTFIAALDRLIEVEKLAGRTERAAHWERRRALAREALPRLTTDEGYFIKSLDPDGVRHGVLGAPKHGYFEAVVNHDAVAFRVADDAQSERIHRTIASLPGLRPHGLVITNWPSLDDMYEKPEGLWGFGTWVNGGHWTTCEARMILAYFRLGKYDDARKALEKIRDYYRRFRIDNPLVNFGADVYQPALPINTVYDTFGAPAAAVRGLFEYLYDAEGLAILPHIPAGIPELEQTFPIRFGAKRVFLSVVGEGPITSVRVNGRPWTSFDAGRVYLPYATTPATARVRIARGGASAAGGPVPAGQDAAALTAVDDAFWTDPVRGPRIIPPEVSLDALRRSYDRIRRFHDRLRTAGLGDSYEAAHSRLAVESVNVVAARRDLLDAGRIVKLPDPAAQDAADRLYLETAVKLCAGLESAAAAGAKNGDAGKLRIGEIWRAAVAAEAAVK